MTLEIVIIMFLSVIASMIIGFVMGATYKSDETGTRNDDGCLGCKYLDFWNDGSAMCTKNIDKACTSNGFKYRELQ